MNLVKLVSMVIFVSINVRKHVHPAQVMHTAPIVESAFTVKIVVLNAPKVACLAKTVLNV